MRIIILCGLPGVGKLTIANGLARTYGYRVFHNHLVFDALESLFAFGTAAFIELRERLWVELLSRAVQERVGDVIFTVARDLGVDAGFPGKLVAELSRLGAEVCCVELTCNDEDLDHRVASAGRGKFGKIQSAARFRELRTAGAFPLFALPPGTITVDTSGLSVPQAIALVAAKLNDASRTA